MNVNRATITSVVILVALLALSGVEGNAKTAWPPVLGKPFPDLELVDQTGEKVRMSSFKGSVILVEMIGMTCPACQAFSGAHRKGAYGKVTPQSGLQSIEEYFPQYANGVRLDHEEIVFVQILLYDMLMKAPSSKDAEKWAEQFDFDRSRNEVVLAGEKWLVGPASFKLIPGFQLIDRNFIVRSDSTGHHPKHNLFTHLLPMVPKLLAESTKPEGGFA